LASPGKSIQPPAAAPPASSLSALAVLAGTGWVVGAVGVGLALTLLLLAAGPEALARMTAAFAADWHAVQVLRVIDSIRLEVGRYYGTLALINIGFGLVTALTMGLLGMPNPMLWGALAGVLNFVPYLGCATTFAVLTVVSLVTFDQLTHTLMVSASFLALAAIEGHIIEPIFIGRRLDLNPIVVLVALWVGGWMWGIAGMVFALPGLVAAKVAAAHSSRGRRLVRLLSPRRRRAHRRWQRGRRIAPRIARDPTAS
jgi:predicted PurR-regulated permease PerM